jgi:2-methylisocitrate lyase-like PEP mutase family enzyme
LIMARTDARAVRGLQEALARCRDFASAGADITFLEAPQSEAEMRIYCDTVPGPKMANLLEQGKTPMLPTRQLERMGYKIAVYPLTLLNASINAMRGALECLRQGRPVEGLMDFEDLQGIVGFQAYDAELERYL